MTVLEIEQWREVSQRSAAEHLLLPVRVSTWKMMGAGVLMGGVLARDTDYCEKVNWATFKYIHTHWGNEMRMKGKSPKKRILFFLYFTLQIKFN